MAKSYHNLAGLVRDLRNARGDASEGSKGAAELLDTLYDELDLLLGEGSDDDVGGEDDDGDGGEYDATPQSPPVRDETKRGVDSVGAGGPSGPQHAIGIGRGQRSTRDRLAREARPRPGQPMCLIGRGGRS